MTFRQRLLLTSLTTLAVGLGALLVAGNVLLAVRVHDERSTLLGERAQAQIAALDVTPQGVAVRETANDATLDRQSWVFDGSRVVERPAGAPAALDRAAVAFGRAGRAAERDGPDDVRLRAEPVYVPGMRTPAGAVVVALSAEPLEHLQQQVLIGSLVIAGFVLLAGLLAIRGALLRRRRRRGAWARRLLRARAASGRHQHVVRQSQGWSPHPGDHDRTHPGPAGDVAGADHAQQGPGGHPLLLGHQDPLHHGRGDRGGLPERGQGVRADQHDVSHRGAARRAAPGPVSPA